MDGCCSSIVLTLGPVNIFPDFGTEDHDDDESNFVVAALVAAAVA